MRPRHRLPSPVKFSFALLAIPVVAAAAWRVARQERRTGLGRLIQELRGSERSPLPRWLARPEWLAATLEPLLPLLPPWRYGPCLKRALILLDLWSRCGLRPTVHLGFGLHGIDRQGHAWLTAKAENGREYRASGPLDSTPAFEL